jgi:cytochrome c-type biogenesis protein
METLLIAIGSALWLGLLTSISPCPLATNIAPISFIGKQVDRPSKVLLGGLLYTLGRTISYIAVALVVVTSLLSISTVAMFLQHNLNKALGPLLLVVGLLLLDVIRWPWTGNGSALIEKIRTKASSMGLWGAAVLGLVFALTFCPVSGALFFGSLIPLAVKHESSILLPSIFGVGTALPVVVFSVIVAFAANKISTAFNALSVIERWMRRLTAAVFIVVGGYYCLVYLLGVL